MTKLEQRPFLPLIAIFLLALALRIIAVLLYSYDVAYMTWATESGIIANNMVEGRGYTFDLYGSRRENPLQSFVPPLFPLLIAACLRYFDDPPQALGIIHAILSSLTVIIIYHIAAKLSSNKIVGLLAAAGTALHPVFVIMCSQPPSLTLNVFILSLFLLMVIVLQEKMTLVRAATTGLLLGIALLTRPMILVFLPLVFAWLWINSQSERTKLLKIGATVIACAAITILPWTLRNYDVHNQIVPIATSGGITFWCGNNPFTTGSGHEVYTELADEFRGAPHDPESPRVVEMRPYPLPEEVQEQLATIDEVEMDRALLSAGLRFIRDNPRRWLELAMVKTAGFWWFRANIGAIYEASWTNYYKILYIALLLLAVPGSVLSLRRWRKYSLLYLLFATYTLFYMAFHVQTRFRWEIEPYLVVFAALTVSFLLDKARVIRNKISAD